MIRGIEGRGEAHASTGIAHAHQGLALGHRRRGAEPTGHDAAAQPAAIVTLSSQGRALAQRAIEAERAQAAGHRAKGAKRPSSALAPAVGPTSLSAGTGGASEITGAIATRRAMPRGIAKKLAASLSVVAATPNAQVATTQATTRTSGPALAEPAAALTANQRTGRAPAWGHLIRHGGQDVTGAEQAARRAETAPHKAVGRGTLQNNDDARLSARALMQAAAARLVAEARTRRDDQKTDLADGPSQRADDAERASREKARPEPSPAQRAPQAAQAAVAAAAAQAGLALPTAEASAS
jgi:hypothetical protein